MLGCHLNNRRDQVASIRQAFWADLTTDEFIGLNADRHVALLPIGATEQHGPHLPLNTDTCIANGITAAAMEYLADNVGVLILPTFTVGSSDEHQAYPGTLSHPAEALIGMLTDIGDGVARAGLRRLVIFNTHGGQPQMVDIAGLRMRLRHRMLVVKANVFRFGMPDGLFAADELRHGVHGGAIETSLMLHLCPDCVRHEKAADFEPSTRSLQSDESHIGPGSPANFAWAAQDLHPSGAVGDATAASTKKGAQLATHYAKLLAAILADASRFPLDLLKDRP
jgi:creatinine amidohydrolase